MLKKLKELNKVFLISIILENISSLNSPTYDVMQGSGCVYAGLAGDNFHISQTQKKERYNFMNVLYIPPIPRGVD